MWVLKFFHRNWKLALIRDGLDKTLTDLFNKLPKKMRNFDTICLLSIEYHSEKLIRLTWQLTL